MTRWAAALLVAGFLLSLGGARPARAQFCGVTYLVQPGDTLYSIAEKCRVSYLVLMSINVEMRDPNRIWPGQVIRLEAEAPLEFFQQPASGPAQDAGLQPGGAYVVRPGDSLARIAYLYDTTVPELVYHNPQLNGRATIHPGEVLLMPPSARHEKGWVGVSTLTARWGLLIEARAADFTPYARLAFQLGIRDEEDSFQSVTVYEMSDARGDARVTLRVPFYAWRGDIWEVRVINLDDGDAAPVRSPAIRID